MRHAHPWRDGALALLLAAAAGGSSLAADTVSEGAQWEARPSQADFERLGPPAAVAGRISGSAKLDCALTATGRLRDCRVTAETPAGAGFGEAALRLAPFYRLARTQEVDLEGSRLPFVVRFRYAELPVSTPVSAPNVAVPSPSATPSEVAAITPPSGALAPVAMAPGWQTDFLDIDRTLREGALAETYRVTVYAGARGAYPTGAYEVARLRLDCETRSQTLIGVRVFDRAGGGVGWRDGEPARTVESDSVEEALLDAACRATDTRPGATTLAQALAGG